MMLSWQCMQDQTKTRTKLNNYLTRIKNFAEIPHDGPWLIGFSERFLQNKISYKRQHIESGKKAEELENLNVKKDWTQKEKDKDKEGESEPCG